MSDTEPSNPKPQFVDVFEARYLGRALKRHGWVVLACAVIGGLVGAAWSAFSPRVYRAEAVLLVNIQSVRIGADGIPLDVELVPPARRTVGTICQSDAVMAILAARLAGEPDPTWPGADELAEMVSYDGHKEARTRPVRDQFNVLYFDQRSQEEAGLRAVDRDPAEAARLANTWAEVCRQMLVKAYGTTAEDVARIEQRISQAKAEVLAATAALDKIEPDVSADRRLELSDNLDRAQKILGELNVRYAQLKVREQDSHGIARIVSAAAPPARPINPSLRLIAGLFTLAGGLLGLAIALLRGPGKLG
ncbi:MAG: GNVR domain-containing protein [Phycisphaerales bacterium]